MPTEQACLSTGPVQHLVAPEALDADAQVLAAVAPNLSEVCGSPKQDTPIWMPRDQSGLEGCQKLGEASDSPSDPGWNVPVGPGQSST